MNEAAPRKVVSATPIEDEDEEVMVCPKCGAESGDDWSRCGRSCPMPMSPWYSMRAMVTAAE